VVYISRKHRSRKERLPLLQAWKTTFLRGEVKATSPGSMEGVPRGNPLYLSREPGGGQHVLIVVDLLHGIPASSFHISEFHVRIILLNSESVRKDDKQIWCYLYISKGK